MFVSPDTTALTLQPGDMLVLCTDGLHDEMSAATIAEIVSQPKSVEEIARELVARAVEIDGNDNTTAQVIRVRSVEQVGMYRGRPYRAAVVSRKASDALSLRYGMGSACRVRNVSHGVRPHNGFS